MNISRAGIIVKRNSPLAEQAASDLVAWLGARGISTDCNQVAPGQDLIITLGGDGTLLHIAAEAGKHGIPVLGINMGDLGFLTEVAAHERYEALTALFADQLRIHERMLLEIRLAGENSVPLYALNELLVTRNDTEQIMAFRVMAGDDYITTYRADGLIFSTPTGSTAYNLSAGGPIVDPRMHAILVTPVCPFMLGSRPLVLPADVTLSCRVEEKNKTAAVIIDGRPVGQLSPDLILSVSRAPFSLKLACPTDKSFFEVLCSKLHWGFRKHG